MAGAVRAAGGAASSLRLDVRDVRSAELGLAALLDRHGRLDVPVNSLAGRLDVPELAGLIAAAGVLVSNNTGPVHLAAGMGTPVAVLYALTNPQHTPWAVPSRVLNRDVPCRNCYQSVCPAGHHGCLVGVPPDEVAAAAAELLAERDAPSAAAPLAPLAERGRG